MLLKGKKAIVTGGARGIGKEIVMAYVKEGASVYIVDLMESEFLGQMQEEAKKTGATVVFKKGDVSSEAEITKVIEEVIAEAEKIDILVNNAGITRDGLLMRMAAEDWEKVLKINLTSAFYISKIVVRHMLKQKGGSIINMASVVGVGGNAGQANYAASKAGLIAFARSLAKEVGSKSVRVNSIAPGYIITDMTAKLPEAAKQAFLGVIPMGRGGEPKEVADIAVFLASDMSSYVTGQVIRVDGGMSI
jgi:3-oxoacyl-[acyl-carrier protein] reductase